MTTMVVYTVQVTIAILINAIFLAMFVRNPSLRATPSNIFLINLIGSDIVTAMAGLVACINFFIRHAATDEIMSETRGITLFMYIFIASLIDSLIAIILVTMDRFIAITQPFKYREMFTKRNVYIQLITSWIIVIIAPILGVIFATTTNQESYRIAQSSLALVVAGVSIFGMVFLAIANLIILGQIRKQIKLVSSISVFGDDKEAAKKSEDSLRKKEMRAVYLCFSIVGMFIISWLPFAIGLIINKYPSLVNASIVLMDAGKALVLLGIALNPCLYVPFKSDLRAMLLNVFSRRWSSHETTVGTTNLGTGRYEAQVNDKSDQ